MSQSALTVQVRRCGTVPCDGPSGNRHDTSIGRPDRLCYRTLHVHSAARMSQPELAVASGAIVALRLFDVAFAIDLARAEALLAEQARTARRSRLSATPPKAMAFGVPPVELELEPVSLILAGRQVAAAA